MIAVTCANQVCNALHYGSFDFCSGQCSARNTKWKWGIGYYPHAFHVMAKMPLMMYHSAAFAFSKPVQYRLLRLWVRGCGATDSTIGYTVTKCSYTESSSAVQEQLSCVLHSKDNRCEIRWGGNWCLWLLLFRIVSLQQIVKLRD